MNQDLNRRFIEKIESFVKPKDVTTISFLGDFNKYLPMKIQNKIMKKGSEKIPYMGFIVDPYCLFLSYKIKDREKAQNMLPQGFELAESSLFKEGEKHPIVIFSAFSARTSAFIGVRLEMYIIARNIKTGNLSWIISDYETNTNSHDPAKGFCGYTSDPTIFTTTPYGELLIDIKGKEKRFSLSTSLKEREWEKLDEDLWIEGNLSVDYGGDLKSPNSSAFSLIFDPLLMEKGLRIAVETITLKCNTYLNEIINFEEPLEATIFPFSQHFLIRQDLKEHELADRQRLGEEIDIFTKRESFKRMEGDDIKKPLFRSMLISNGVTVLIILALILKLIF